MSSSLDAGWAYDSLLPDGGGGNDDATLPKLG